jgi:hypothetical protein
MPPAPKGVFGSTEKSYLGDLGAGKITKYSLSLRLVLVFLFLTTKFAKVFIPIIFISKYGITEY